MNKKLLDKQVQAELENYFECARAQECPPAMKKNLYQQIAINGNGSWLRSWFSGRFVLAGLSLVLVSSVIFKLSNNDSLQQNNIQQAQTELQIAMHYMNRVSFKSLTAINNKGLKPGLIKPLARSVATL